MRDSNDFDFSGFWQQNQKLVVIVGAGVSREAGIPVGTEIVEKILTDLDGSLVRRIVEQTRGGEAKNANFFQVLAVYKDVVGEKKFWEFLEAQLKYHDTKQMAAFSESYDLLAHLLHYENLAAIISLNFDELLDKALELESQSRNSAKIIRPIASLSDFAAVLDDISRDPEHPTLHSRQYFKPHGTIGKRLTIRVSEDKVRLFEPVKRDVLSAYLDEANIITLGWGLRDPDLLSIMNNTRRPKDSKVIVVAGIQNSADNLTHEKYQTLNCTAKTFLQQLTKSFDSIETNGYGQNISTKSYPQKQRALGSLRHQIRGAFFGMNDSGKSMFPANTRVQAALEILMLALKARGHFTPHILLDCPRTERLFVNIWENTQKNDLPWILKKLSEGNHPLFGKSSHGELVYWLNVNVKAESSNDPDTILKNIADQSFALFIENVRSWVDDFNPELLAEKRNEIIGWFTALTQSFDIDIAFGLRRVSYFLDAEIISNRRDLREKTLGLLGRLKTDSNSELLVSTYTGEWLLSPEFQDYLANRSLKLIVDDYAQYESSPYSKVAEFKVAELKGRFGSQIQIEPVRDKAHNMTVLATRDGVFLEGLYFHRELKTTQVCPVYLKNSEDLETLKRLWMSMSKTEEGGHEP